MNKVRITVEVYTDPRLRDDDAKRLALRMVGNWNDYSHHKDDFMIVYTDRPDPLKEYDAECERQRNAV